MKESLKIEIRHIPNQNGIREFSENLEYFSQPHIVSPLVDSTTRKYVTGLDEDDIKYLKENNFPYNFDDNNYHPGMINEFWSSSQLKMDLKTTPDFLYPEKNLLHFIKYKYLLKSKFVYASEEEMSTGCKPEATHYLYNQGVEIRDKARKIEYRKKIEDKISKLTLQQKRDIVLVMLDEDTDNKNEDYLTVRFEDILKDKKSTEKLRVLLEAKKGEMSLRAEIKTAINKDILSKTKKGIFYFDTPIGFTEDDVLTFLDKKENQEIYSNIKSKL